VLLVCTVYSVLFCETAVSRKPFGIEHLHIYNFLLRMTDTVTSQNIDFSSLDTLNIQIVTERFRQILGTSSTYHNKRKYPYQYVSGNIWFGVSCKNSVVTYSIVINFDIADYLVGSHVSPHRVTGNHYRDILLHDLPKQRARMWNKRDGAPCCARCSQ
jgi:hypothetical protein